MNISSVSTDKAPAAIGPYSQAIASDDYIFCSGQVALDPASGELLDGSIGEQTRQAMNNLSAVLTAAGTAFSRVVKTTIYLTDMNDFAAVNEVYAEYFEGNPPARATVGVAALPKGAKVEIDCVARS